MKECGHTYVWDVSEYGVEDTQCEREHEHPGAHTDGVIWWDDKQNRLDAPD